MTTNRFRNLHSPDSTKKLAEWVDDEMDMETVICPVNDGHQRAGKRLTDLSIVLPGRTVEDFVWTWYSECLLQDHVLKLFQTKGLTGFEVKPVKARFKKASGERVPKLWELIVTGWAGMASPKSGIKLHQRFDCCGHTNYSGLIHPEQIIEERQWDGSDFFMVWPLPKFIFVSGRVAQIIEDANLKGADLIALKDMRFEADHTLGGGRLSYWMPEQLARQLGEPLGIY